MTAVTTEVTTETTTTATTPATAAAVAASGEERAAGLRVEVRADGGWAAVCRLSDLVPGRGVAALLPDGRQIAVFRDRAGRTYAVGNRDPFTGAYVLSRGLLGSAGGRAFVASPLLKQRFDLATGRCLDDDAVSVPVYAVRTR
ncbi:nitrite reductase (NADH) small subunit [Streptomyces radiopugnans]|uniref:Nitrite reductase (NADH) small subunit n=1 Tax=Streptomyces radiopugnans TaxID=403935 RepID=A0A1H8Z9P4_9ACTN|nr:nitrite reductase small subunit NirD [Streptomyces radiopugnans]SEP60328.1 nitrite reductase (NADH) small subunit [Streptomyces radiopugnans]